MLTFRSCGAKYNGSRRLSSVLSWASREEALANMCDAAAVQLPGPGRGHASLVQNHQLWSQSKRMVVTAASVSCLGTHSIRPVTTWCGALLTYCSGPGLTTQLTSAHLSTEPTSGNEENFQRTEVETYSAWHVRKSGDSRDSANKTL